MSTFLSSPRSLPRIPEFGSKVHPISQQQCHSMVVGHREYDSNGLELRRCLSYRKQEWRVDVMDFPCKAEAIELVRSIVEPSRTRSSDGGYVSSHGDFSLSSGRTTIHNLPPLS